MSLDKPRIHTHIPHCHSALSHYECFHLNTYGSSYGNSVFEYNYNFNGGGLCSGGFWGGLWGGIGFGIGNFLGGLLGGIFGGGFGGFGFGGGGYSPYSNTGGGFSLGNLFNIGRKSKDGAGGQEKAHKSTTHKCEGKDAAYLHELRGRYNNLLKTPDKLDDVKNLYNDIKAVIKKQHDDEHDTTDENNYKDLLNDLKEKWDITEDDEGNIKEVKPRQTAKETTPMVTDAVTVVSAPEKTENQTTQREEDDKNFGADDWTDEHNKEFANVKVNLNGYTNGGETDVTKINLKGAYDNHSNQYPAPVNNEVTDISKSKLESTKFPLYIKIKENSGKVHKYKCIGTTNEGYAVYRTPDSDTNRNQYILAYNEQEHKYVLTQEGLGEIAASWGKGQPDIQPDAKKEEDKEE